MKMEYLLSNDYIITRDVQVNLPLLIALVVSSCHNPIYNKFAANSQYLQLFRYYLSDRYLYMYYIVEPCCNCTCVMMHYILLNHIYKNICYVHTCFFICTYYLRLFSYIAKGFVMINSVIVQLICGYITGYEHCK